MGSTLTPNLGLRKPDKNERVKDWPILVGDNLDKLDRFHFSALTAYSPAVSMFASIGTGGEISGRYKLIQERLVFVTGRVFVGTGPSLTATTFRFTYPPGLAPSSEHAVQSFPNSHDVGRWVARDDSGPTHHIGVVSLHDSVGFGFGLGKGHSQTNITHIIPFTWAAGDRLSFYALYVTG